MITSSTWNTFFPSFLSNTHSSHPLWVEYDSLCHWYDLAMRHTWANGILANLMWTEACLHCASMVQTETQKACGFWIGSCTPVIYHEKISRWMLPLQSRMNTHRTDLNSICNLKQNQSAGHSPNQQLNYNQPADWWTWEQVYCYELLNFGVIC